MQQHTDSPRLGYECVHHVDSVTPEFLTYLHRGTLAIDLLTHGLMQVGPRPPSAKRALLLCLSLAPSHSLWLSVSLCLPPHSLCVFLALASRLSRIPPSRRPRQKDREAATSQLFQLNQVSFIGLAQIARIGPVF